MDTCPRSGKTVYPTTSDAHKAIAALKHKRVTPLGRVRLHIYRCTHCGGFHTTKRDLAELRRLVAKEPNR